MTMRALLYVACLLSPVSAASFKFRAAPTHPQPLRFPGAGDLQKPWTMKAWERSIDAARDCWMTRDHHKIEFLEPDKESRVIGLEIFMTGSENVIDALNPLADPNQKKIRKKLEEDITHGALCTLSDAQSVAGNVVVTLRHPVGRFMAGLNEAMGNVCHHCEEAYNKNFKTADAFIDALRDPEHAMHTRAMLAV